MLRCKNYLTIINCFFIFLLFCCDGFGFNSRNINSQAELNILFIVDGLRPDLINAKDTPNIYYFSKQGVTFENSHAVFPTVTRVNSAAIATGAYPEKNGIVSNSMFVPMLKSNSSFSTGDYKKLRLLDELTNGQLLLCKTWAQRLSEHGFKTAAISSGSTGSAFLLNHRAPEGVGLLINPGFEPDSVVAFPQEINSQILRKFGSPPNLNDAPNYNEKVNWTIRILTDYVLTEVKPDVIYCWMTEPDHTQHDYGIGSAETNETIRNSDRNIGVVINKIKELGIYQKTNILVVSDHGFSTYNYGVNVKKELIDAGLKESEHSDDVVLASSGQSVLIHVKDRNPDKIKNIVRFFQIQDWIGVIFTAKSPNTVDGSKGSVEGTFSLELIHMPVDGRGSDMLITFPWFSKPNKYGFPGMDCAETGGRTGPRNGVKAGHGSMSPWTIRNTMIAWGVDFKPGLRSRIPTCSIDFTATILALKNIPLDPDIQGRVLHEALKGGPDIEKIPVETSVFKNQYQGKIVALQISRVGKYWYVDKSWRMKD